MNTTLVLTLALSLTAAAAVVPVTRSLAEEPAAAATEAALSYVVTVEGMT